MKLFAAGLAVSTLLVFFSVAQAVTAPVVPYERPITVSTFATTTTSTTTTTLPVPASAKCGGFWNLARSIGWAEEHLEKLDYVMWRESRCLPKAFNPKDPNEGSAGLTQINYFWTSKTRYFPLGYLQTQNVLRDRSELFNPRTNLAAALVIFEYSQGVNGCGWKPWLVSCS